jgi:hypothetical protein
MSNGTHDIFCEKCESELLFISPNAQLTHIGTDYWTLSGQRRWKPLICMACRTKIGQHAKKEQDKQIVKAETDKHVQILNNILQGL